MYVLKHTAVGTVASALVFVAVSAQAGAPAPSKLDTIKVTDDIYVIHNEVVPGNVTVLITDEGVLLVDDKFEVDHENLVAEVRKLTTRPIRYVVNTHYHGDHSGGNVKLQAMGVQVVASQQAQAKMIEVRQPGVPTVGVNSSATINLGGKRAELLWFGRAHTDGDLVVYFPQQRVLAAGDMFTFGDATPQLIDYSGGGSARDWTGTIDKVLMLDFATVVPGHGTVTTKQELRNFRDSTVRLRDRVRQLAAERKTRAEIEAALRAEFKWGDLHVNRALDGIIAENR